VRINFKDETIVGERLNYLNLIFLILITMFTQKEYTPYFNKIVSSK